MGACQRQVVQEVPARVFSKVGPGPVVGSWMRLGAAAAALVFSGLWGCVHVYHPLRGLHRPGLVPLAESTFDDLTIRLICQLDRAEDMVADRRVCAFLDNLLSGLGATVEEAESEPASGSAEAAQAGADLVLKFVARRINVVDNGWMYIPYVLTLTTFPVRSSSTFDFDVSVSDRTGQVLSSEQFQARFIQIQGGPYWFVNQLANWFVRERAEKVSRSVANERFSNDLAAQIVQMIHEADLSQRLAKGRAHTPSGGN